jgi:thiosulfate reductase cytochrome b subunit
LVGAAYLLAGLLTRHLWRNLLPRPRELAPRLVMRDVTDHLRLRVPPATGGPHYGLLQKCSYFAVVFIALPLMVATGLSMSPAITAAMPSLSGVFGGHQSARTIHFFAFAALTLFLLVHVLMVVKSGFRRQMRAMTIGRRDGR